MFIKVRRVALRGATSLLWSPIYVRRSYLNPLGNSFDGILRQLIVFAARGHDRFGFVSDKFIQQTGFGITGNEGRTLAAALERSFASGKIQTGLGSVGAMAGHTSFFEKN